MINTKIICGECPVCHDIIPMAYIKITITGRWKKTVDCDVAGDVTDYMAHMWGHQQRMTDPRG